MVLQIVQGHPVGLQGSLTFIQAFSSFIYAIDIESRCVLSHIDTLFNVIQQGVLLFFQCLQLLLQLIVTLGCAHIAALLRRGFLRGKLL